MRHPASYLRFAVIVASLCISTLSVDAALSGSSLTNGEFDASTVGWTAAGAATITWSNEDADENGVSGSALITAVGLSPLRSGSGAYQCVPVHGGSHYTLSAMANTPTGQLRLAFPGYRIAYYDAPGCSGQDLHTDLAIYPTAEIGSWTSAWKLSTAPPSAAYAWVGLMAWADVATDGMTGTEAAVRWDKVAFSELNQRLTIAFVAADP